MIFSGHYLFQILRFWKDDIFDQATLEALLESHMDFLACPIALVVLRFVLTSELHVKVFLIYNCSYILCTKWRISKQSI